VDGAFDSYDQRNDDIYYMVTIRDERHEVTRFMVQVFPYWAGEDWTGPGFVECLHREIHKVAVTGTTNTGYTGAVAAWPETRS
jgi:hypothetical protein